jgi:RNA-binding protein YhbY
MDDQEQITTVIIGKQGMTDDAVQHIKRMLQQHKLIRVRFLSAFIDAEKEERSKKEIFAELSFLTGGRIAKAVGFVVILKK